MYDAVIFDMDGTLIEPLLDFGAIRAELGVAPGEGLLEALDSMSPERRAQGYARLVAHEMTAAQQAELLPGAGEVVSAIQSAGLKIALLTRNTRPAVTIVLERHPVLRFDLVLCREDGLIKPQPDGVQNACRAMRVAPARTVCVGDFHYDLLAANAAGAVSVLLSTHRDQPGFDTWRHEARYEIDRLDEL